MSKQERVGRFPLDTPICDGELYGPLHVTFYLQQQSGFFAQMNRIASPPGFIETTLQFITVLLIATRFWLQMLLRDHAPQQQAVNLAFRGQPFNHLGKPFLFQQQIGIGTKRVWIVTRLVQGPFEVLLGNRPMAAPGFDLRQRRQRPLLLFRCAASRAMIDQGAQRADGTCAIPGQ